MRISIKVSNLMNLKSKYLGSLEDRVIRVPAELRELCAMELGSFANLMAQDGKIVSLRVSKAYEKDVESDTHVAYVTRNVFDGLKLSNPKMCHEQEIDTYQGVTLGCDPELFLVFRKTGKMLSAKDVFHRYGQVGTDGFMLEFRPLPSTDEWVVAANIGKCLQRARQMLNSSRKVDGTKVAMLAASCYGGICAGFHLHFGIPRELRGGAKEGRRWHINNQIARVLDYYVGIPSIVPEGEKDSYRRTSTTITYGKPGEWRQEGATFEYRVPGGYMLRHPVLTVGLLGLGAIVMEDTLSRLSACTDNFQKLGVVSRIEELQEIYPNVPTIFELYKYISCKSVEPAKALMDKILTDLTRMVGFERRKKSIEQMFRAIYDGKEFNADVENNWRPFYNEKQQRSVGVLPA
jgi:hypothetical protein